MKHRLRPCDCKDMVTASKLNEQGIGHNGDSITVEPNVVVLKMGHTTIRIPMGRFKMFAEWYLEEQEIGKDRSNNMVASCVNCKDYYFHSIASINCMDFSNFKLK